MSLKPCPACNKLVKRRGRCIEHVENTYCHFDIICCTDAEWNNRPIEDALNAEIAGLKKKLEMTQMLLKDMTEIHAENCNELECVNILAVKKFTEETDAE